MTTGQTNRATRLDMVALTISPPDIKHLTVNKIWILHKRVLSKVKSKFVLYPELDTNGRLHYHGYIHKEINLKEDLELIKSIGYIKVKEITDWNGWITYCSKEWKNTKKLKTPNGRKIWKKPINNNDVIMDLGSYDITTYFS